MRIEDYIFDVSALKTGNVGPDVPLVLLDLGAVGADCEPVRLPPCPVIGLGDSRHALAGALDCIVEHPVRLEGLVQSILARPMAAAVLVQLLRLIEGMDPAQALVAESLAYATLQAGEEHASWLAAQTRAPAQPRGCLQVTRDGATLRLEVARAEARNAIDAPLRDALREALELAVLDDTLARVELTGAGKAFGVGADLAEFGTTRDPVHAHMIRMHTLPAHLAVRCADRLVSTVQGLCVGASLELAAFGRIVARRGAIFHLPELAMGLLPGAGGCVSMTRRIGRQRTALMVLSGRRIDAGTALDWGLVEAIID